MTILQENILFYETQRILLDSLIIGEKWDLALAIALEHTESMKGDGALWRRQSGNTIFNCLLSKSTELLGMTSPVLGIQYYRLGKLQMY
jgi:hypothetical protein